MGSASPAREDAHYFVIKGRRWRRTDPNIPDGLRRELTAALMDARRAVKDALAHDDAAAERAARGRVNDCKVALGERGAKWWEASTASERSTRATATLRALLAHRGADKTLCPSDIARVLAGDQFRAHMDEVRALVSSLEQAGEVEVRQKGKRVTARGARGPIRIALARDP